MSGNFETRLADLGVTLPDAPAPAANYVPYVVIGDIVYVSGQVSNGPDGFITGSLRRRSGPARAGCQTDGIRQFHRRFH